MISERAVLEVSAAVLLVLCMLGCSDGPAAIADGGVDATMDGGGSELSHLTRLESSDDYALLQGEGGEIKYLAQVPGTATPTPLDLDCAFQNTRRFPFHVQFVRSFEELGHIDIEAYVNLVLHRATRVWWAGSLKAWPAVVHPRTERTGIIGYQIYRGDGPDEAFGAEEIAAVDARLKGCATYAQDLLVFTPAGSAQVAHVRTLVEDLRARGVSVRFPEDLTAGIEAEGYSLGQGYGYLRVVPIGSRLGEYGPRDVVIAESVPDDVSVVAGLVTSLPQSVHSHVNLRLREKEVPNALVPSIYDNAYVLGLEHRLVRIVVEEDAVEIEPARLSDAEAFWAAHRPSVGPVTSNLGPTELASLMELGHDDADAYGAKAANLGELYDILPEENRVAGFGIPLSAYVAYVEANNIDVLIAEVLDDERVRTDYAHRAARLDDIRDAFRDGSLTPGFLAMLQSSLEETFGPSVHTTRIRFRSSTNAEDLDIFSGAGLYRSKSGCLADDLDGDDLGPSRCLSEAEADSLRAELARRQAELVEFPARTWLVDIIDDIEGDLAEEKTIAEALKKVWGSLWGLAAFDERDYYGIDHRSVYMGISVNASFVLEQREAVVLTHLRPDEGAPLYRVVSQVGEVGVVRPDDPTATPETLTFRRASGDVIDDVQLVVPSSLAEGAAPLWSEPELVELGGLLFLVHDHFRANVYPEVEELSLDVEIELTSDGRIVLKQARPYLGASG